MSLCSCLCFISWSCEDRQGCGHGTGRLEAGRCREDGAQSRLGSPLSLPEAHAMPWMCLSSGLGSLCPPEQHPGLYPLGQGGCDPLVPANHQPWVTFWEEEDFYLNKEI